MLFKKSLKYILPLFAMGLLSCASEKDPLSQVKVIDAGVSEKGSVKSELFCLEEFSTYINNYFEAKLKKNELEKFWNCTAKSIEVFQKYAKPNAEGVYPAEHVRNFLTEYFWPRDKFSNELLSELMYFKRVLFGGRADSFSPEDFRKMESFLANDMKTLTVSLVDDIGVLTSGIIADKKPGINEEHVNKAVFKFRKVMREFGFAFARHGYSYPFSRIQKLLMGLKPLLVTEGDEKSTFARLEIFVPVIQETKVLLVGPDRNQILSSEWGDFFVLIANAYSVWLRSVNFIAGEDITEGAALSQFHILFDEVLTYIQAGISKRLIQVYTHEEAKQWLRAMSKIFTLPFDLELSIVEKYWGWMVDKLLALHGDGGEISGLTPRKVAFIQERFTYWYNTQLRINQTWGDEFDMEDPRLGIMQRVFKGLTLNLSFDDYGRVMIPNKSSSYDRKALTYLNFESAAVDIFIRAYATDKKRKQETSSLSLEEADLMFKDLHPLLVYFDFLDLEDVTFVRRFYRDTSLFVSHANGDEWIDFGEAVSFLHYAFSGYRNSQLMKSRGLNSCTLVVDKQSYYMHNCFKEFFAANLPLYVGHLPKLESYLKAFREHQPGDYHTFVDNLMLTVASEALINGYFTSGELLKFHVLLQYVETFMLRFDLNGDSYMDPDEVELFLQSYMAPIAMLLGQNKEGVGNFIRSFFTYIVKYHKSPLDTGDHGSSLRFHLWSKLQGNWQFKGERLDLSYVLKILGGF